MSALPEDPGHFVAWRARRRAAPADAGADRRRARAAPLLAARRRGGDAKWLGVLALYDLVFGLLAYAVFDFLLED